MKKIDFGDHLNSNFKSDSIFKYNIEDFSKEEIELIRIYCEEFLTLKNFKLST